MPSSFHAITNPEHHHVALRVRDMSRMMHFYGEVLGLPYIRHLGSTDAPRVVWYQAVQLVQADGSERVSGTTMDHLAVSVLDIEELAERLIAAGVTLESPIAHQDVSEVGLHLDNVFFRDPEGNRVELVQWVPLAR